MPKPNIKYWVTLAAEERAFLQNPAGKGKTAGRRIRRAQILLALDGTPQNRRWTDAKIGAAYGSCQRTVGTLRKRFVEGGSDAALERKKREVPPAVKTDGEAIALTCSRPPKEGRAVPCVCLPTKRWNWGYWTASRTAASGTC